MTDTKTCQACGETKPLDDFYSHNTTCDGRRTTCRECHNARRHGHAPTSGVKGRQRLATFDVSNEAWMGGRACKDTPTSVFFPGKGSPHRVSTQVAAAKAICAGCPVTAECLAYAEKTHVQFGIFGGLTETDRRKLRKQQRGQAA